MRLTRGNNNLAATFKLTEFVSFVKEMYWQSFEDVFYIHLQGISPKTFIVYLSGDSRTLLSLPDSDDLRHADIIFWRQMWVATIDPEGNEGIVLRHKRAKHAPTKQLRYTHGKGFEFTFSDFEPKPASRVAEKAIVLTEYSYMYNEELFKAFLTLKEMKIITKAIELRGVKLADLPPHQTNVAVIIEEENSIVIL